jgi:hypothetical protein
MKAVSLLGMQETSSSLGSSVTGAIFKTSKVASHPIPSALTKDF